MLRLPKISKSVVVPLLVVLLCGVAYAVRGKWLPQIKARVLVWASQGAAPKAPGLHDHGHDDHGHGDDHGHDHGAGEENSIKISAQGLKNIGFKPQKVMIGPYRKTVRMPAMIVERPGRTQIHVAAPMGGIITRVLAQEGAAVESGSDLFELRLTHEDLVASQRDFLRTAESLDVVNREIKRLQSLTEGLVAGKRLLEQEYEKQKLEGSLLAERQGLLLHGLSEQQVDDIQKSRRLLKTLMVRAPEDPHHDEETGSTAPERAHAFHLQRLDVQPGQQVDAGATLGVLADHCELFVEGRAFEDSIDSLRLALAKDWAVDAHFAASGKEASVVRGLKLLYMADHVDEESRAFRFYLTLPNEPAPDRIGPDGRRYPMWRFRPGQRLEVDVPVDVWEKRIVLPVNSVVDEGAESYVFRQNGSQFTRVPVHVEHRDRSNVVIVNDGALYPGDVIAANGAYQLQLAIKNQSGGGIDPHAGHNH